ncbi:hypothetical protein ACLOJK_033473 [Asimina triloba]
MLLFQTMEEAEQALGRTLTYAEKLWFRYSARMPDILLYYHNIIFLFVIFSVVPLPLVFMELKRAKALRKYKLQPKVLLPSPTVFKCYKDVMRMFFLVVGPLQLSSYPAIKLVGIRTGLPLPSGWEIFFQLLVYFLIEDYGNYWIHRLLHCKWGYEKIHRVHHEFSAPIGFAAPYAHWAEVLILGIPSFVGPAIVPGHMVTFWLWIALRQIEAIETHSGRFTESPLLALLDTVVKDAGLFNMIETLYLLYEIKPEYMWIKIRVVTMMEGILRWDLSIPLKPSSSAVEGSYPFFHCPDNIYLCSSAYAKYINFLQKGKLQNFNWDSRAGRIGNRNLEVGYRYQKEHLTKMREQWRRGEQSGQQYDGSGNELKSDRILSLRKREVLSGIRSLRNFCGELFLGFGVGASPGFVESVVENSSLLLLVRLRVVEVN